MTDATLTPGGLALDADGNLAALPRDLVCKLNHQLGEALALLDAAEEACPDADKADDDPDSYHNAETRTTALIRVAAREVRDVMNRTEPYF